MKNLLRYSLFIFVMCIACILCNAQNLKGGITLGMNASQVDGDFSGGFNQIGIRAGGFVGYKISENFSLQGQLLFEQLGSAGGNQGGRIIRTNYFSFPLLAVVELPILLGEKEYIIQFQVGPAVGVLLDSKDFFGEFVDLNSPDLRGLAGFAFALGKNSLTVHYGYSLTSLAGQAQGNPILTSNARGLFHNYVSFGLNFVLFSPE
ncbi:MAG: outer membrane beta-barrel protein [Bacteroidota bacterium]